MRLITLLVMLKRVGIMLSLAILLSCGEGTGPKSLFTDGFFGTPISFNTSNVTHLGYMFWNASSLTSLDLSHFDTSSLQDVSSIFNNATSLTSIDLTNWDTSWLNANFGTFGSWKTNVTATIYCNDPDNGGVGAPGTGTIFSSVPSLSVNCN